MHKSIPISIIALLLIASPLAMFGNPNSNLFSKAMAIEEEEGFYEANEYTTYGMEMANEYGNDEYKSPSATNDNNYNTENSDFIKKIKCNNINSNLNGVEDTPDLGALIGVGDTDTQEDEGGGEGSASVVGYGKRTMDIQKMANLTLTV